MYLNKTFLTHTFLLTAQTFSSTGVEWNWGKNLVGLTIGLKIYRNISESKRLIKTGSPESYKPNRAMTLYFLYWGKYILLLDNFGKWDCLLLGQLLQKSAVHPTLRFGIEESIILYRYKIPIAQNSVNYKGSSYVNLSIVEICSQVSAGSLDIPTKRKLRCGEIYDKIPRTIDFI